VKDKAAVVVIEGQVEGEGGSLFGEESGRSGWERRGRGGGYGTMIWGRDQER